MTSAPTSVFFRDDTFFGVCEALGEDFRINSNILRVVFALGLFFNPLGAIAAYAACGVLVLATRLLVPDPRLKAEPAQVDPEADQAIAEQAQAWEELAVAA